MHLADPDGFILIYDFLDEPPRLFFPLVFLTFGVAGYFMVKSSRNPKANEGKDWFGVPDSSNNKFVGYIFILFSLIGGLWTINLSDYFRTRSLCNQNNLLVIEGYVTRLQVTNSKNDHMGFYVNGKRFSYSSNDLSSYGCRYQDLEDENIKDSTYLKLYYYNKKGSNVTLRVKIKSSR